MRSLKTWHCISKQYAATLQKSFCCYKQKKNTWLLLESFFNLFPLAAMKKSLTVASTNGSPSALKTKQTSGKSIFNQLHYSLFLSFTLQQTIVDHHTKGSGGKPEFILTRLLFVLNWIRSQSYKRNLVLKKSKLVLNYLMVCYLNTDHNNMLV